MTYNPDILRAYDIRGVVGTDLFPQNYETFARAFATILKQRSGKDNPTLAVGRDGRNSTPDCHKNFIHGLTRSGIQIVDIGVVSSPMLYFTVFTKNTDGGAMITASHNPPQYNGLKMMIGKSSFWGDDIVELGQKCQEDFQDYAGGTHSEIDIYDDYSARITQGLDLQNRTVVWDASNGAAGQIIEHVTKNLPGNHILMNTQIDGNFPAHDPDPTKEKNLDQLKSAVAKHGADVGFCFDGDGDRLGVVTNTGQYLVTDELLVLYMRDILSRDSAAEFVVDLKCSDLLIKLIESEGGKIHTSPTGHSIIKSELKRTGSLFAGEMSGHIFFNDDYYGYDDALYSALRLLKFLDAQQKPLQDLISDFPKTCKSPEYRLKCPDSEKKKIMDDIISRVKQSGESCDLRDGVRVSLDGGWLLIRASNTENAISVSFEALDETSFETIKSLIQSYLSPHGLML